MQAFILLFAAISADIEFPAGVYPTAQEFKQPAPAFRTTTERFPRFMYFMSDNCIPCRAGLDGSQGCRKPLESSNWSIGYSNRDHLQLVDIDKNPELAEYYGVTQTPMVVLVDGNQNQAVPYRNLQSLLALMPRQSKAALVESDLLRIGCKLRPDLGSGINTEYGMVTCSHCVRGNTVQVECDGEVAVGTVIARDAASDVALVSVPWKLQHPTVGIASSNPSGELQLVARSANGSLTVTPNRVVGRIRWVVCWLFRIRQSPVNLAVDLSTRMATWLALSVVTWSTVNRIEG